MLTRREIPVPWKEGKIKKGFAKLKAPESIERFPGLKFPQQKKTGWRFSRNFFEEISKETRDSKGQEGAARGKY